MKILIKPTVIIILFFSLLTLAQNQAPVVENVIFTQRSDDSFLVDIYFDVKDADGDTMNVNVLVSNNAGTTFDFGATSISGDVGDYIVSGTSKHIIWDFETDHPDYSSDQIKIKIIASDGVSEDAIPCPGLPTITYAEKVYNIVLIGDQCWLKENLNVGTMINVENRQTDNSIKEKYCYLDVETYCESYGGFYLWDEAMQYFTRNGTQGICPDGWHIPTYAEFLILKNEVNGDGNALKAVGQDGHNQIATNTSGFSALLSAGNIWGSWFNAQTIIAIFWSSSEYENGFVHNLQLKDDYSNIFMEYNNKIGNSIRCLKNDNRKIISITSPNGGEVWWQNNTNEITWDDNIEENVKIELWLDNSMNMVITESTESDGEYTWDIPYGFNEENNYKIKILSVDDSTIFDTSDTNFNFNTLIAIKYFGRLLIQGDQEISVDWIGGTGNKVVFEIYKDNNYLALFHDTTDNDRYITLGERGLPKEWGT